MTSIYDDAIKVSTSSRILFDFLKPLKAGKIPAKLDKHLSYWDQALSITQLSIAFFPKVCFHKNQKIWNLNRTNKFATQSSFVMIQSE